MEGKVFELLEPRLKRLVKQRFGTPTPIQREVIPAILSGKDILTLSETGSGKTEAALLPIFNHLITASPAPISVLYITPLKSLNRDLLKRILWWANKLEFEVSVRHGDTTQYERSMQAANPSEVMITTPETLQALLTGKVMRTHIANVQWVIVDEVHELVSSKRGVQLSVGLERLKHLIHQHCGTAKPFQIIGLSATVGSPKEVANFLTAGKECTIVNTIKQKETHIRVESPVPENKDLAASRTILVSPDTMARIKRISTLIDKTPSTLVFTNTRESAEILSSRLKVYNSQLPVETHHSSLSRDVRIQAEQDFKDEKLKALLCTSSLELGIDIGSIELILQYMSPRQVAKLLQRTGRSGHSLSRISKSIILSSDADDCFESAVIAHHALRGRIEATHVYRKSLDVLGHQIIGMALEEYTIPFMTVYETVRKAHPFKDLSIEEFFELCSFMEQLGFLWINEKGIQTQEEFERSKQQIARLKHKKANDLALKRRRRSWTYYYQNLSTIPDVKNYKIHDIISNKDVGSLDAEFVALHGDPGAGFICKGRAWKVLEVRKDKIIVEPMHGIEAAIPAWEGELIPVPCAVAQDVGRLRGALAAEHSQPLSQYPLAKNVSRKLIAAAQKQKSWGFVPTDKNLLLEYGTLTNKEGMSEHYVIIHTCFGSLVNETIGRTLSILLTDQLGSVGFQSDPYRIMLKLPVLDWDAVVECLKGLTKEKMKTVLETALPTTELFRWRFLNCAKRFGIIAKDAEFGKGYLKKIIEVYANTPLYREALNELFQEKLDLEQAAQMLEDLKKGISLEIRKGISPLGHAGLARNYEIVAQEKPEQEIFSVFKKRLLETRVGFVCMQCGFSFGGYSVQRVKRIICTRCGARLVSTVPPRWLREAEKLVKKHIHKRTLTHEEQKLIEYMQRSSSLIITHELDAVKAIAGRGVGPRTAARILGRGHTGDALLRDILEAERTYARNKRFWRD